MINGFGYFLLLRCPPVVVKLRDFCREKLRTKYFIYTEYGTQYSGVLSTWGWRTEEKRNIPLRPHTPYSVLRSWILRGQIYYCRALYNCCHGRIFPGYSIQYSVRCGNLTPSFCKSNYIPSIPSTSVQSTLLLLLWTGRTALIGRHRRPRPMPSPFRPARGDSGLRVYGRVISNNLQLYQLKKKKKKREREERNFKMPTKYYTLE